MKTATDATREARDTMHLDAAEIALSQPCTTHRRDLVVLLVLLSAAFVLYAVGWPMAPIVTLDSPSYMHLAQELKAGQII
jgi:hypothetical protein